MLPSAGDVGTDAELPDCSLADAGVPEGCSEPETEATPDALGVPELLPLVLVKTGSEDCPGEAKPEVLGVPDVAIPTLDVTPEDETATMFRLTSISYVTPKEVSTMT